MKFEGKNWTEVARILEPIREKVRLLPSLQGIIHGDGIMKDDRGWYIFVHVMRAVDGIPTEIDGVRIQTEVRGPAFFA